MNKDLDRLCRGYKILKNNDSYSDDYLILTAEERRKVYEGHKRFIKDDIMHELDCLLDYLESGLFNSFYAHKNPKKIIDLIKYSYINVQYAVEREDLVKIIERILEKLREIYREIRRHPHENDKKFGPVKKAIKELEEELERLNAPTSRRRKIEKEDHNMN